MVIVYKVTEYGIERKNYGGHVDWEIVTTGDISETFRNIEEAEKVFGEWADGLRSTYMVERACAPRLTMVGRGYRVELEKLMCENEEAAQSYDYDTSEILKVADYTSDDYDDEQRAQTSERA